MAPQAGVNGVLPVAVLQKNAAAHPPRGPKASQPRLKLICRRLPPGLSEAEFKTLLGDAWTVGAGKVDGMSYNKGKISRDAAKPSRPSRVYVHVTKPDYVKMLGDHVRELTFHDAAKSWQDPALVGPPVVEYAAYPKMPGGRRRNDNRQGTIDQDQEFKDFLESLTNPITKPAAAEDGHKQDKVKTTPLIEALREKKANKEKTNSKAARQARGEAKEEAADRKGSAKSGKENALGAGDKNRRMNKAEKAQAAKEAVKILNKEAASTKEAATAAASNDKATAPSERKRGTVAGLKSLVQRDLGLAGAAPNRRRGTKREVASATPAAAPTKEPSTTEQKAKEPTPPGTGTGTTSTSTSTDKSSPAQKKERPTRAERRAFKASLADKSNEKSPAPGAKTQTPTKAAPPVPQILKKPQSAQSPAPPKGPAASRVPTEPAAARHVASPAQNKVAPAKQAPAAVAVANATPRTLPANPVPSPSSKQAFLKHANPSQGITEPLIEEALQAFGGIDKVEIDKRKGFAYVDFADPQGLQKAMAASPIKIAQGAVQVLERKEKVARAPNLRFNGPPPTGPARGGHAPRGAFAPRGGRGGRGGARGGAHVTPGLVSGPAEAAPIAPAVIAAPANPATPATDTNT